MDKPPNPTPPLNTDAKEFVPSPSPSPQEENAPLPEGIVYNPYRYDAYGHHHVHQQPPLTLSTIWQDPYPYAQGHHQPDQYNQYQSFGRDPVGHYRHQQQQGLGQFSYSQRQQQGLDQFSYSQQQQQLGQFPYNQQQQQGLDQFSYSQQQHQLGQLPYDQQQLSSSQAQQLLLQQQQQLSTASKIQQQEQGQLSSASQPQQHQQQHHQRPSDSQASPAAADSHVHHQQLLVGSSPQTASSPQKVSVLCTIGLNLPPHIEESNLCYMFNKIPEHVLKVGKRGTVQFSSFGEAQEARRRWTIHEKILQRDDTDYRKHIRSLPYGTMVPELGSIETKRQREEEAGINSSKTEAVKRHKPDDAARSLQDDPYKWCTIEDFSKEKPENELVRAFRFVAAAIRGSVSPNITLCAAGPMGNHIFASIFGHAFATHLSGRTWKGKIRRRHLAISKKMGLCGILLKTVALTCEEDMIKDILSIILAIDPLYRINGHLPPYYAEMITKLKKPPRRSNPNELNAKELSEFHLKVLKRPAFATPELRSYVVQEFYTNTLDLEFDNPEWTAFDISAPVHLEDWQHITRVDKLLEKNLIESSGMEDKFGKQCHYMRHLVVHSPEDKQKKKYAFDKKKKEGPWSFGGIGESLWSSPTSPSPAQQQGRSLSCTHLSRFCEEDTPQQLLREGDSPQQLLCRSPV